MSKSNFKKYLLYAIGEILLIIIGILIAVKINSNLNEAKEAKIRCTYLNELLYTIELDRKDVEDNLIAFDLWIPKIEHLIEAHEEKSFSAVDSIYDKFGTVGNYINFGQRSKSKVEELKYANIDLILNRKLKNKLLVYQDERISWLRELEVGYKAIGEDLRRYYAENFSGFNYGEAIPLDINKIQRDNYFHSLMVQRVRRTKSLYSTYEGMIAIQDEIQMLIKDALERDCIK